MFVFEDFVFEVGKVHADGEEEDEDAAGDYHDEEVEEVVGHGADSIQL